MVMVLVEVSIEAGRVDCHYSIACPAQIQSLQIRRD